MNELQHRCRSMHISGARRIFARISPNLPENFWAIFCALHEEQILDDLQKKRLHVTLGAIFSNQNTLGAIFACIFGVFAQIFRDFAKVFIDFVQISLDFAVIFTKSKLLGVHLHPCLLHH